MTSETKDVRLPVMVTASEAARIDDFRFANRIPTRAEAMRRLIKQGLDLQNLCIDLLDELEVAGLLNAGDLAKPVAALETYLGTKASGEFEQRRSLKRAKRITPPDGYED